MWLVPKHAALLAHPAEAVPRTIADALRRAYVGVGSDGDEATAIRLVARARTFDHWIACDCRPDAAPQAPLLAPAYLTTTETYYIKRLTGSDRIDHHPACPFHAARPEASLRRLVDHDPRPRTMPDGMFAVLPPLRDPHLAVRPDDAATDRTAVARRPPLIARQLWRLLVQAERHIVWPVGVAPKPDLRTEQDALARAAQSIAVAPGIPLSEVLGLHPNAFHSRALFARLRTLAPHWPPEHQPQAYLVAYATGHDKHQLFFGEREPIEVSGTLHAPAFGSPETRPPYLTIIAIGHHEQARGYAALRAYAQPILAGNRFLPVSGGFERDIVKALLKVQWALHRARPDLAMTITRPLFDIETPSGSALPDALIDLYDRTRHGHARLVLLFHDFDASAYRLARQQQSGRLAQLGPVIEIDQQVLDVMAAEPASFAQRLLDVATF